MKKRIVCLLMTLIMLVSLVPATMLTASAASLTTSEAAIKILKDMEGYKKYAYWDYSQYSIGYGSACGKDEYPDGITQAEADELLRAEVAEIDEKLNNSGLALNQQKHDALVLFSYNCGTAWLTGNGTFKQAVVNGATGNEFLYAIGLWSNAGGSFSDTLMKRRLKEANMYLNGAYSNEVPSNYTYVTYNANADDATVTDKMQAFIAGSSVAFKSTAARSGYTFMGWYDAAEGGAWVSSLSNAKKGATLYAHWQSASETDYLFHTVSYTLKKSQLETGKMYNIPSTKGTEEGTVTDDTVTIVRDYIDANGDRWCKVSMKGWVKLGASKTEDETGNQDVTATSLNVTVTNSYINVRNYPSTTSGKLLGKVYQNDKLVITEVATSSNGMKWGKFSNATIEGWVALMYTDYDSVLQQAGSSSDDAEEVIATAVVKCSSAVNVRNAAGMSGAVIGSLRNGTKVNIYEIVTKNGHDWGRISDGWFCLDYATVTEADSGSADKDEEEKNENVLYTGTVVGCTYLKVREGAGTTKAQVGQIACGTKVEIYETTTVKGHDWGRISDGWICLDYVTLDASTGSNSGSATQTVTVSYAGKVKAEADVDVQKAAGSNKAVVETLKAGTKITVHELTSVVEKTTTNPDANTTTTTTTTSYWARIDEGWVPVESIELDDLESVSYTVICDTLNVREAAGATNEKVDTLSKGTEVEISDLKIVGTSVWGYIANVGEGKTEDGVTEIIDGWVNIGSAYMEVTKAPETSTGNTDGTTVEDGYMTGTVVCSTTVNVRAYAGTGYDVVDKVTNGTKLTIKEETVTNNGHKWGELKGGGWICLDYVRLDATSTGSGTASGSTDSILGTGIVTSSIQLNVREGAGLGYNIVKKLDPGTEVTVYEQKLTGGMIWGRIDGGWACLSYVKMLSTGSSSTNGSTASGVMGTIANTYTGVNIRSNPGTGNALLGKILPGTRVEIFEQKLQGGSYWGRVSQGWICMDYVLLDSELPEGAEGIIMGGTTGGSTSTSTSVTYTGTLNGATEVRKEAGSDKAVVLNLDGGKAVTVYELSAVTTETSSDPVKNEDGSESVNVTKKTTYWARIDEGWVTADAVTLDALDEETYTVTSETLNVREGAGTDHDKITALAMGDKVTVTDLEIVNDSVWAKVETADATTGWVNISYMAKGSVIVVNTTTDNNNTTGTGTAAGTTTGTTTPTHTANNAYGYLYTGTVIGSDKVNVRQQATTGSDKTTSLKRGAAVVIYELAVGDNMAWGRCDAGWISLVYVDLVPYNSTAIDARVVQVEGTNIRESADANSELVGSYAKNTVIDIYEFVGNWARTDAGWVHTDNLLA